MKKVQQTEQNRNIMSQLQKKNMKRNKYRMSLLAIFFTKHFLLSHCFTPEKCL